MTTLRPKARCLFCEAPRPRPGDGKGVGPGRGAGGAGPEVIVAKALFASALDACRRPGTEFLTASSHPSWPHVVGGQGQAWLLVGEGGAHRRGAPDSPQPGS